MAKKKNRARRATKRRNAARSARGGKRPSYDVAFRQKVAEHSILHGIHAAAKEFGVSAPSVTTWRKAFGINRRTKKAAQAGRKVALAPAASSGDREGRGYSESFRREVAEYSILSGIQSAAKKYKVSSPSVTNWRKAFGITRQSKRNALAKVSQGGAVASPLAPAERRELRKRFGELLRACERVIAKL